MRTQILITASLALALSAPAALAFWSSHGGFEPDYPADVADGFMFPDPDVDLNPNHRQVYFNAFVTPEGTGVNPNAGALQSRVLTPDLQMPSAYLGVWKDCNMDGYIGNAESALLVYHSTLLIGESACPEGSSEFNSGGWVYEFLWIGPDDANFFPAQSKPTPRMYNDQEARVWGDAGLPGGPVDVSDCFINPQTGTFSGTGALLAYGDCSTGYAVASTITAVDPTGQLGFDNPRRPQCSDSLLNVRQNVFNDDPKCPTGHTGLLEEQADEESDPSLTAMDCESTVSVPVGAGVVGDEPLITIVVGTPDQDPTVNPTGSYYEASENVFVATMGACDPDAVAPPLAVLVESPVTSDKTLKRETSYYLTFQGYTFHNFALGPVEQLGDIFLGPGGTDGALAPVGDAPVDGGQGIVALNAGGVSNSPMWAFPGGSAPEPYLVRSDLSPAGPQYYTFYARITESTLYEAPGGDGFYGSEWCGSVFSDAVPSAEAIGFDCDAANWWDAEQGASAMPKDLLTGDEIGQVPGAEYNLRDIDCYDGSVTSLVPEARGVGLGLSLLSETEPPCAYYVAE